MKEPPNPTPDFTACPHWGKGGRYIINADGQRVPAPADAEPSPAPDAAPAVADQPVKKGK